MESFKWGPHFITGITEVDKQHKSLVAMINEFGEAVGEAKLNREFVQGIFFKLYEYTQKHFDTERLLMLSLQLDSRHVKDHLSQHNEFVSEVSKVSDKLQSDNLEDYRLLFEYLVHWLAYHILCCDKNMARQVRAIENGITPAEAFIKEEKEASSATEPLVNALSSLFSLLSVRNKALEELNKTLEIKVEERTKDLVRANEALEIISITDHLTQLPNRRFAMRQLNLLWLEKERTLQPLAVLMVDADGFKEVNDTYGHDAGDIVLQRLAKELQHSVRSDDIVCRLGGDEFIIICPDTDLDGALYLGNLVLNAVTELTVPVGEGFWYGSVSIGVASSNCGLKTKDALIKAADDGVYKAKEIGKKCVKPGC